MCGEFTELFFFVTQADTGEEALVYSQLSDGSLTPLAATNAEDFESFLPIAQRVAAIRNQPVRGLHTTGLEQVCIVQPPADQT